jgi:hypothetical protein
MNVDIKFTNNNQFMLIIDMSEVEQPGEAKQNNLPPDRGQPTDAGV